MLQVHAARENIHFCLFFFLFFVGRLYWFPESETRWYTSVPHQVSRRRLHSSICSGPSKSSISFRVLGKGWVSSSVEQTAAQDVSIDSSTLPLIQVTSLSSKPSNVTLASSVEDPDPASGAFLTPGSGIRDWQKSYFRELKKQYLNSLMWIRDGKMSDRNTARRPHTHHFLFSLIFFSFRK